MKNLSFITLACLICCACSTQVTEQDFKNAFAAYMGQGTIDTETIALVHKCDITVGDSIAYYTVTLAEEYQELLANKKQVWEEKQADCELDEKANILRHEDYMKKYNEAKRKYGNDIKYKNKIEGYLKAAQKLPSNHEEYLKFDRSRSYSFSRDAEQLKAEYEEFLQLGAENYAANHPFVAPLVGERNLADVVATVYNITYTTADGQSQSNDYVFDYSPLVVKECLEYQKVNIVNYKSFNATDSTSVEIE